MPETVIAQFVAALGQMSSRDLYQLAAVLRDKEQREAAISVITGLAGLKTSGSETNALIARRGSQATNSKTENAESAMGAQEFEAMRDMFFALLNDKVAFPNTEDVITEINSSLGFKLKRSDLKGESRNQILTHSWERLETLSHKERTNKLRVFCDRHRRFEGVDAYKELFKILSRG